MGVFLHIHSEAATTHYQLIRKTTRGNADKASTEVLLNACV